MTSSCKICQTDLNDYSIGIELAISNVKPYGVPPIYTQNHFELLNEISKFNEISKERDLTDEEESCKKKLISKYLKKVKKGIKDIDRTNYPLFKNPINGEYFKDDDLPVKVQEGFVHSPGAIIMICRNCEHQKAYKNVSIYKI